MYKPFKPFKKGLRIIEKNTSSLMSDFLQFEKEKDKSYTPLPVIKRGKGPYIYDYDDNRFVDFFMSAGSLLLGHAHPVITKIIKSWLGRGYASGYVAASHELLSKRLFQLLLDKHQKNYRDYKWFYYNSSFEAVLSLFSLLEICGHTGHGIYLSGSDEDGKFTPFHIDLVERISPLSIDEKHISTLDFVIIRFGKTMNYGKIESILKRLHEKGVIIVSDETEFNTYIYIFHNKDLQKFINVRVFGNWVSSGISFGCIFAENRVFTSIQKHKNSGIFQKLLPVMGFPPYYKIKAAIEFSGIMERYGGIEGLIQKNRDFFLALGNKYFNIINNNIYIKENEFLFSNFRKLHSLLLENSIYFPFSPNTPIFTSLSHSNELLQKSAGRINLLFNVFYR